MRPLPDPSDACPTGLFRHAEKHAAQTTKRRLETMGPRTRGRRTVVHCPDCDGHHIVVVSKHDLRRRNPKQRARFDELVAA